MARNKVLFPGVVAGIFLAAAFAARPVFAAEPAGKKANNRESIDLGVAPTSWMISDDGKFLLAIRRGFAQQDGAVRQEKWLPRVMVVDIEKKKIVLNRTFEFPITTAAMDEKNIYVGLESGDALVVLNREKGNVERRIFLKNGRAEEMRILGGKVLWTKQVDAKFETWFVRYQLPELTLAEEFDTREEGRRFRDAAPVELEDGWFHRGVLWDKAMDKARMIIEPDGYARVGKINWEERGKMSLGPWGVEVESGSLIRDNKRIRAGAGIEGAGWVVLKDSPCVVYFYRDMETDAAHFEEIKAENWRKRQLLVADLVTGNIFKRVPLISEPCAASTKEMDEDGEDQQPKDFIKAGPGFVVVLSGSRFFVVPEKELAIEKAPLPLHFRREQAAMTLDLKKPAELKLSAAGGKGKIHYELTNKNPWLAIDGDKGIVTVSPEKWAEEAVRVAAKDIGQMKKAWAREKWTYEKAIEKYREPLVGLHARILGRRPAGVPVVVTVGVEATDEDQMNVRQEYGLIVELPEADVIERMKEDEKRAEEIAAKEKAEMELAKARAATMPRTPPRFVIGERENAAQLQAELEKLEKRNIELKAQVELLKDILKQRNAEKK